LELCRDSVPNKGIIYGSNMAKRDNQEAVQVCQILIATLFSSTHYGGFTDNKIRLLKDNNKMAVCKEAAIVDFKVLS